MSKALRQMVGGAALILSPLGLASCGAMAGRPLALSSTSAGLSAPRIPLLLTPALPATLYRYSDASSPLPQQFLRGGPGAGGPGRGGPGRGGPPGRGPAVPPPPPPGRGRGGPVIAADRTPTANPLTDAGATVGRVLFYDVRLSANNTVSCGSCHQQALGFGDSARLSRGLHGLPTARHAMALANARFYGPGRYFWDQRAGSLEEQVLQPIQNPVEMGMSLDSLLPKLRGTSYYAPLFTAAFGTPEVTQERIANALAQFVRSLVSGRSAFDTVFNRRGPPDFSLLTPQQQEGQRLFAGRGGCQACHGTNAHVLDGPHNNGLDATITDVGAGGGMFKAPSLRNVAVRGAYMHDGRFKTLRQVVDFYDHGVQPNPLLDRRLRGPNGAPRRLNLSPSQRDALVAYLESLTDTEFLTAPKFSNPFVTTRQ